MSASLPAAIMKKYKVDKTLFFETGTSNGDTVQTALEGGFDHIISVEMDADIHFQSALRFSGKDQVLIALGDSVEMLHSTLPLLAHPIMFFLDAHADCSVACTPMIQELAEIAKYPYDKVILIDDMRLLGLQEWAPVTLEKLIEFVYANFPGYDVIFEDNEHQEKDLIVIEKSR